MATTINNKNIESVRDGFSHFYPDNKGDFFDGPYSSGEFNWPDRRRFNEFVFNETRVLIKDDKDFEKIKQAQQEFELRATSPESPVDRTTPENLKDKVEDAEKVEREIKRSDENAKRIVEEGIERQKELYEKESQKAKRVEAQLKEKAVYVKAEKKDVEKTEKVESLRQQAKANPQDVARIIEKNIRERLPGAPGSAAKQAALDIVQNLQTDSDVIVQAQVVSLLAERPEQIKNIVSDIQVASNLQDWAKILADKNLTNIELSQAITQAAFGDAFQKEVLPDFTISFSDTPHEGFQEFSLDQIPKEYSSLMKDNSSFFDGLKGFGVDEVRSQISLKVNSILAKQIEKLPADSTLKIAFNSNLVQSFLPGARMAAPAAWGAVEGSFFGKIAVSSGFAPALGWLGGKTGIDFGIKKITQVAVEKGIEGATGVGLAATITAAFAWTGPLAPVIGAVGAFLIETIGAKLIGNAVKFVKDNAQKYGKFIVAGVGAVFGFLLGGGSILGTLAGGAIGFGGATVAAGGLPALGATAASVGSGIVSFFGALASATLGAVAAPIIATLIGLPVLVAFILVIINNSAYVVPPGGSSANSANPYIGVQKTAAPSGQLGSPQSITYTITITAKRDSLTDIGFENTCTAISKAGGSTDCKNLETIPSVPASISPSSPFTFSFTSDYDAKFTDSLVSDSLTVSAKSKEGGDVSDTGSASVCFGDCPLNCFDFSDPAWSKNTNLQSLLTTAAATLAGQYPNFAAKVCPAGGPPVKICYTTSDPAPGSCTSTFARDVENSDCTINFNKCVGSYGAEGALSLLTHEATHHIQSMGGGWQQLFEDQVHSAEPSICYYGGSNPSESMAEGNALFVAKPVIYQNASCLTNYQSQYPKHYNFAKNVMFAP